MTTFCNLRKNRIFDIVKVDRTEGSDYLKLTEEAVKVVCIDLSSTYRHLIQRYFPNARLWPIVSCHSPPAPSMYADLSRN